MVKEIISIITGIIAIIGTLIGVWRYIIKKAETRISANTKNIVTELLNGEGGILPQINELSTQIKNLKEENDEVKKEIFNNTSIMNENEKDRLRNCVLDFSERLRTTNEIPSSSSFQNVFREYDKYKKLGGNGYVDNEIEFIRERFDYHYNKKKNLNIGK